MAIAKIQNPIDNNPENQNAEVVVNPDGSEIGAISVLEIIGAAAGAAGQFPIQEVDVSEYGSISIQRTGTYNLTEQFEC